MVPNSKARLRTLRDWLRKSRVFLYFELHFLWIELAFSVSVFAILLFGTIVWNFDSAIDQLLQGNRAMIYGTFSSIFASLFGFTIAATTFVAGTASKDLLHLVTTGPHGGTLRQVFMSAIRSLGIATIIALIGLIFDRGSSVLLPLLLVFSALLVFFRLSNCVYILGWVFRIVSKVPDSGSGDHSRPQRIIDETEY